MLHGEMIDRRARRATRAKVRLIFFNNNIYIFVLRISKNTVFLAQGALSL
jgi:hypothetical protein